MWTNVFRVGELQHISWFQFLPIEPDQTLHERSSKAELKDASTCSILSAHLQLQSDGFLSTWTNSFVGPWDPSQGVHNPDEKIKLWLFLPGRHSSIIDTAQAAVSRLRVVGRGLWIAPGDSEEVALALSQALRNSIERALRGLSYMRFGDVFAKGHCSTPRKSFRKAQPTCEFIFSATEEAIYIHAIISAKHVRNLVSDDIEGVLRHRSSNFKMQALPVIVSPSGMRGRLTGCCPADLVNQVYSSKVTASNESTHVLSSTARSPCCQLRGQSCFVEVTIGCSFTGFKEILESDNSQQINTIQPNLEESFFVSPTKGQQTDPFPILERTFIFPAESVLVPVLHRSFARSSTKRFCIRNWTGTSHAKLWPFINLSSSQIEQCDFLEGLGIDFSATGLKRKYNGSCNSNCSSTSSTSSMSSGSNQADGILTGDLEADADSFTSRQSGLSCNDQFDSDGQKMISKRPRSSLTDVYGQAATVASGTVQNGSKSEFSVADANNTGIGGVSNVQIGSNWDWDDDDRGIGIDIQALMSEFGDFGDFFENDILTFGEPPGTAESQALALPSVDCGDVSGSPCTIGIDSPDQRASVAGNASFENFNQPSLMAMEDSLNRNLDATKDVKSSSAANQSLPSSPGKFDYLTKAEAVLTFAPEYAAVESSTSEFCTSIFRNPYLPGSKRVESSPMICCAYVYNSEPPSPHTSDVGEKYEKSSKAKAGIEGCVVSSVSRYGKVYTNVQNVTKMTDRRLTNDEVPSQKGQKTSSLSILNSASVISPLHKKNDNTFEAGHFLLSLETVLATEFECITFQAAMCRIRHALLSFSKKVPISSSKLTGNAMLDMISYEASSIPDIVPTKLDAKKKDSLPVRIAGDIDMRMMDAPLPAPVGVWRSVGVPKGTKPSTTYASQNSPSLPHNASNDESYGIHGQRQPLQELIDSIGLLVQQAASLVDICLDTDDVDGPYTWLALQEQHRRVFSCSPFMVHAGCGGIFSLCHYVDVAGVELIDPLSADVQVSNVTSLLQSDIRFGLKSAFSSLEGPLSLTEWCRGRHQLGDSGASGDAYSFQFTMAESKDALSSMSLGTEPISPPQSGISSSSLREGVRNDDSSSQRRSNQDMCVADIDAQKLLSRSRSTIAVLPVPSLLVGYQDDWLKTPVTCLQLWEKAPLEPYALPKPVVYYAVCPDIDLLMSAATDFFLQLGTVYEACKLGSHTQNNSGHPESFPGKPSSSGLVPVKCPQELKASNSNMWSTSSISDYFATLSKFWNVKDFITSLKKVLKDLKLIVNSSPNQKEGYGGPFTVVYVVCPFPEPTAVLQTLIGSSAALGSAVLEPDKEKQSFLHSQVAKALISTAAVDEPSASNVVMLSGFRIPKLVLQIVTVDCLLRLNKPAKELVVYKEIAFTVYNKARRIPRAFSGADMPQPSAISGRLQSTLTHVTSSIPGIWKDLAPRISGSAISRESELDSSLRPVAWDGSWPNTRIGGLNGDPVRLMELVLQDDSRYMFEPLFVLAEPGYVEHASGVMSETSSSKSAVEDASGMYMQSSSSDVGKGSLLEGTEHENRAVNLHCTYGWTEDWRWLICFWTDSRGELLDCSIFPFGGISSRQDTKFLQNLFIQLLHHTCQILSGSLSDSGNLRQRDIIITRIGCFFELECQEWQRAIYSVGGNDVKKWPVQLRRAMPDGVLSSSNGASIEQQEMGLMQDRTLPSSPSPLYSPHAKSSFIKGGLGQTNAKKQILGGSSGFDGSRGLLQLARSISLVSVSMDHSLHLILPADPSIFGGAQNNGGAGISSYVEGFSSVRSLGSTPASYLLIPSPSLRFLPPSPSQLPTCLTADSPPLAHLLHSKGSAIPQSTAFVVSKSVPSARDDWPCVLAVGLVDHYGGGSPEKTIARGGGGAAKPARPQGAEAVARDHDAEVHSVLESVAAELHALSWMTVSPLNSDRRSALPFHCDALLRLRRLLHYADKELSLSSDL